MRKVLLMMAVVVVIAMPVLAQENYKAEIFGGYQYSRISGANFNGWTGSVTGNMNSWFGITADLSGVYNSTGGASVHQYNFLFGPTVSYNHNEKVKPFAHALFGISHAGAGFFGLGITDNAFGMALGGGVDVGVHKNVAVRLVQADYFLTKFGSGSQNNARISTGLVFRF